MITLLAEQPLLLLFLVAAIGYPLGRLRIGGFSLGVAAVLFAGIAVGAIDERLKLPEILYTFGLVLFVYTIGLASGPGFFASFRRKGLRDNGFILLMLLIGMGLTLGAAQLLDLPRTLASGLFAGSFTNTPALASILEALRDLGEAAVTEKMLAEPVVGYSLTYPMGVIGMLSAIYLLQRLWKVDYQAEARAIRDLGQLGEALISRTAWVKRRDMVGKSVGQLIQEYEWQVIFGRRQYGQQEALVSGKTRLMLGDRVSVIGTAENVAQVVEALGGESSEEMALDRNEYDFRRMFVSDPKLAGRTLAEINLHERFGGIISRVRRGDSDLLPTGDTILALGDRVRVVAPRSRMAEITRFFGDSYKALSEIDIGTFSVGVALGLLLGVLPLPILPDGLTFRLGLAGGPLIVALILGKLGRTGPLVWNLPYSANLTIRQIGLILFLAGVGTRSGYAFVETVFSRSGLTLFVTGTIITTLVALLTLIIGYKLLRIPMGLLTGLLAGLQTQPAVLGFALEQSDNELPNIGYATVYPLATIAKILIAQFILAFVGR